MLAQTVYAANHKVLFVHGSHSNKAKISLLKTFGEEKGLQIERRAQSDLDDLSRAVEVFNQFDLVVFEGVSSRESTQLFPQYVPVVAQAATRVLNLKQLDDRSLNKGISADDARRFFDYYDNGGELNLKRLAEFIDSNMIGGSEKAVAPPIVFPSQGLYHPNYDSLIFSSLDQYLQWRSIDLSADDKLIIGLLLQRAMIESAQTEVIDSTIERLERRGATVIPFFFEVSPASSDYSHLIQREGETVVDLIINFRSIHWASEREKEFRRFGVPVMQTLTYREGDQRHWEASPQGIPANMTPFVLVLPETAGVIDPIVVAATNQQTGQAEPIDYQLDHLVGRAMKLAALKHKPNADKKLTVMVWGDRDMGASFLNVPESLASISVQLSSEGYAIEPVAGSYFTDRVGRILNPFYRDYELDTLLEDDLAELMPISEYRAWLDTLPEEVTQPITDYWGEPEDGLMAVNRNGVDYFVLPRIRNGNMLVMRQPPRADDADEDKRIYHAGTVPMNHFYLAAYYYARTYWGSDAIIHLGTHGSQEWLGGKERGLSRYDQGNLAICDMPVLYPFIVDDVGEAMQAKRRGSAVVLSHMTPPFAAAGLRGDTADIHQMMHEYLSMAEGGVKEKTGVHIVEKCLETNICDDLGVDKAAVEADFEAFLTELHLYLEDLAMANQPLGLHTFGELPERDLVISTLVQMLGHDFAKRAAAFEDGLPADAYDASKAEEYLHQDATDSLRDNVGFKTVETYVLGDTPPQGDRKPSPELQAMIERGKELYANFSGIRELANLSAGLSGRYVPVKNGGDPIRHPESVPTGFNLIGFDPARLPTPAAWEQGKELVDDVIADYYTKHGRYPDKLAFSLWSIEAMRHYGVLESQALYAMGVRPLWSDDGRVIGTEIIPMPELKRPRIDVVLSATGLYRDAFPNVMQTLAKAVEQVAELKEESNFVWRNSQRIKSELMADGIEEDEAEYLSTVRLFSTTSGTYGSGVDDPVFNSDTWESDTKIAENYMSTMGYFYGSDSGRWGEMREDVNLYGKQLSGTDVAMFTRSSNLYGMITSDDPFEFFGGLSLAVRNLDGTSPEMMISNLRAAGKGKMEDAAKFMSRELRTRNFHQRWVEEMMKEGYSGAVTMSSNLSNFWGWQVVDPSIVREDQWQEFYEVYIEDKLDVGINEFFEKVNPQSQAQMLETMLEANRKAYWQADEQTLKNMIERYVELVEKYDLFMDNQKLRDFIDQQAKGFGLQALPAPAEAVAASSAAARMQQVEGQKLEKVEQPQPTENEWDLQLLSLLSGCLLLVILGGWRQLTIGHRTPSPVG